MEIDLEYEFEQETSKCMWDVDGTYSGSYIEWLENKAKQLLIQRVSIMLPEQKEIISKGMELAKQGKLLNDKASIKDYLFGFIDGFRYTKQRIETKGN